MADEELEKKAEESEDEEASEGTSSSDEAEASTSKKSEAKAEKASSADDADEDAEIDQVLAHQSSNALGAERFVYAGYFAAAVGAAFVFAKLGHAAWVKLAAWKPEQVGEPRDEIVYGVAGLLGVALAVHYWRKKEAREYATEVADELSKVTWPTKKEVQNSTLVVVLTTLFATVFFALMDQFWRFITDKVYGF
ncbi:MAG: preprotein translocase subunit SecE [Myxococcales bacterium]|nr:preprotein translocase subunit SecE [Myxococcales bacterium]